MQALAAAVRSEHGGGGATEEVTDQTTQGGPTTQSHPNGEGNEISTYERWAQTKEAEEQQRGDDHVGYTAGGIERRSAKDSRYGRGKFWFPPRALVDDPNTGEAVLQSRNAMYGQVRASHRVQCHRVGLVQVSHDWGGIIAGKFSDSDLLSSSVALGEPCSCRIMAVAVGPGVATAVGEGSASMVGLKASPEVIDRVQSVLGTVDWTPLRNDAVFEQAKAMLQEMAAALGLRCYQSYEDALAGVARPSVDEVRAEVKRAVAAQIEDLVKRNVLQVADPRALAQVGAPAARVHITMKVVGFVVGAQVAPQGILATGAQGQGSTASTASKRTTADHMGKDERDASSDATMPPAEDTGDKDSYVEETQRLEDDIAAGEDNKAGLTHFFFLVLRPFCFLVFGFVVGVSSAGGLRGVPGRSNWVKGAPKSMDPAGAWSEMGKKSGTAGANPTLMRHVTSLSTAAVTTPTRAPAKKHLTRSSTKRIVAKKATRVERKKAPGAPEAVDDDDEDL